MKGLCRTVVALLWIGSTIVPSAASQMTERGPEVSRAASAGLDQARRVVEQSGQPGLLGLTSLDEVKNARLGSPLEVRTMSYDALLAHQPGAPYDRVFEGPDRAVVPVEVDGRVRSWIALTRDGDRWQSTGFGDAGLAAAVDEIVRSSGGGRASLIHAPAFSLYMVAREGGQEAVVVPAGPSKLPDLKPGEAIELGAAVERIADHARAVDAEYGEAIRRRGVVD